MLNSIFNVASDATCETILQPFWMESWTRSTFFQFQRNYNITCKNHFDLWYLTKNVFTYCANISVQLSIVQEIIVFWHEELWYLCQHYIAMHKNVSVIQGKVCYLKNEAVSFGLRSALCSVWDCVETDLQNATYCSRRIKSVTQYSGSPQTHSWLSTNT